MSASAVSQWSSAETFEAIIVLSDSSSRTRTALDTAE
jgi:hypothetical protein